MARASMLLAFVRPSEYRRAALRAEAEAAACEIRFADTLQAAALGLAARHPAAVIVDLECPDAEAVCQAVRSKRREVDIAIFGVTDRVTDQAFATALRQGADDLFGFHAEGALSARVVSLPSDPWLPSTLRGDALVAVADQADARKFGRVLANAGYEVEYASAQMPVTEVSRLQRVRLVVADGQLGDPRRLIQQARSTGGRATWILVVSEAEVACLDEQLRGLDRVAVVSAAGPPDDILFVSNDVAAAQRREFRIEPRLLHGALVSFRAAGAESDDHGFTYNISPAGIYVRTLAPPLEPLVWLELCPPGMTRRVRLEGEVAWRRAFARLGAATAPPGFGVRITGGLSGDREAWAYGCARLLECQRAGHPLEPITNLPEPALPAPAAEPDPPKSSVLDTPEEPEPAVPAAAPARAVRWRWAPVLVMVAVLATWWGLRSPARLPTSSPPGTPISAAPTARALPSMQEPPPLAAPMPAPGPTAAASSGPRGSAEPPGDPGTLLSYEGYLRVSFAADRWVFVNGVKLGRTNQWLSAPCGWRFVRVGEALGQWSSEGVTVHVVCRDATQVAIELAP